MMNYNTIIMPLIVMMNFYSSPDFVEIADILSNDRKKSTQPEY